MDIIELHDIRKQYGDRIVFQDVNLTIPVGSFAVVRGESGAGKSTLLNLISGLEIPNSGKIVVDGKDISELAKIERTDFYRHEVGIIFQGSYLQPQFTLMENITLPGVFAGMPEAERNAKAQQLAQMLGITESLSHLPSEVSGGQAERACIARALLMNPKIILADEPTSNLDEENAIIVLKILNAIRQQMGITIIVASHSRDVSRFATQILFVKNKLVNSEVVELALAASEGEVNDNQGAI